MDIVYISASATCTGFNEGVIEVSAVGGDGGVVGVEGADREWDIACL